MPKFEVDRRLASLIIRVDRESAARFHRDYAAAIALTEIDGDPGRQHGSIFGRGGPWGRPLAESRGNNPKRART